MPHNARSAEGALSHWNFRPPMLPLVCIRPDLGTRAAQNTGIRCSGFSGFRGSEAGDFVFFLS